MGKISKELCEDASFISDDFIAVIDGVTSKSDFRHNNKTTGKIGSEIIRSALKKLPKDATVEEFIDASNKKINNFYEEVYFPYSKKEKGIQAVCTVYSKHYREVWIIGDCEVLIDGKSYSNPKRSDDVLAEMRCLVLQISKLEAKLEDSSNFQKDETQQMARGIIEPWILRSNIFANNDETNYGYAVINGNDIPKSLIKKIKLDKKRHEIILASDGYPRLKKDLKESEDFLEKVLREDKECCNLYISTKGVSEGSISYDDRTFIKFLT